MPGQDGRGVVVSHRSITAGKESPLDFRRANIHRYWTEVSIPSMQCH